MGEAGAHRASLELSSHRSDALLFFAVLVRLLADAGNRSGKFPVAAKKTGLFEASAATVSTVSVIVRTPDACLKRPVPPVI